MYGVPMVSNAPCIIFHMGVTWGKSDCMGYNRLYGDERTKIQKFRI
jgi:hypothetical protein